MNTTISITAFKATCLKVIDDVQRQGDVVVITKHGRPAAKLVPIDQGPTEEWFGRGKGTVREKGGLYMTGEAWDADS
jgi:prevent-host-death family protein